MGSDWILLRRLFSGGTRRGFLELVGVLCSDVLMVLECLDADISRISTGYLKKFSRCIYYLCLELRSQLRRTVQCMAFLGIISQATV